MRHALRALIAATLATAILAIVYARTQASAPPPTVPEYGSVPDFALTERSGKPIRLADLAGKVWIADFIFTRCAGPCPKLTARMARLAREFASAGDLRLVSFTLDPDHDTPAVLSSYADKAGAPPDRWLFVTGPREAIESLSAKGMKLGAGVDDAGTIFHNPRLVLIDRAGKIRGYYEGEDDEACARLAADLRKLLLVGAGAP